MSFSRKDAKAQSAAAFRWVLGAFASLRDNVVSKFDSEMT